MNEFSIIYLDPKIFISMILNTRDEILIKYLLNVLFSKNEINIWNNFDTMICTFYLLKQNFKHKDLRNILKERNIILYNYYKNYCKNSFIELLSDNNLNKLIDLIYLDREICFLYSMYVFERSRFNMLSAFPFYKNYYDRLLAHLEYKYHPSPDEKKPNIKKFFSQQEWKKVFNRMNNSNGEISEIIEDIFDMRNNNPICHSSSELITHDDMNKDILLCIEQMDKLFTFYKDTI